MKSCPGVMGVLSGTFTSTVAGLKVRLSHSASGVPDKFVTCASTGSVAVAVNSGADVFVGSKVVGVKAAAVSVNCDTTVPAADVRTAATSGVGSDRVGAPPQP